MKLVFKDESVYVYLMPRRDDGVTHVSYEPTRGIAHLTQGSRDFVVKRGAVPLEISEEDIADALKRQEPYEPPDMRALREHRRKVAEREAAKAKAAEEQKGT